MKKKRHCYWNFLLTLLKLTLKMLLSTFHSTSRHVFFFLLSKIKYEGQFQHGARCFVHDIWHKVKTNSSFLSAFQYEHEKALSVAWYLSEVFNHV